MAASTKKRPRRYHTPGVVSGNLARELNHQELERRLELGLSYLQTSDGLLILSGEEITAEDVKNYC